VLRLVISYSLACLICLLRAVRGMCLSCVTLLVRIVYFLGLKGGQLCGFWTLKVLVSYQAVTWVRRQSLTFLDPADQKLLNGAPLLGEFLHGESSQRFDTVLKGLGMTIRDTV